MCTGGTWDKACMQPLSAGVLHQHGKIASTLCAEYTQPMYTTMFTHRHNPILSAVQTSCDTYQFRGQCFYTPSHTLHENGAAYRRMFT